jgi:hypothetical protein
MVCRQFAGIVAAVEVAQPSLETRRPAPSAAMETPDSGSDTVQAADAPLGIEAVGPLLLRSEAVASSKIERLAVSQLNLARALVDPRSAKGTARAVAANVLALERAVAIGDAEAALTVADFVEIHCLRRRTRRVP